MQDDYNVFVSIKRSFSTEMLVITTISLVSYLILTVLSVFVVGNNPVDFILQVGAAVDIANGKLLYRDIGERVIGHSRLPRPQYPPLYLHALGFVYWVFNIKQIDDMAIMIAKIFLTTFVVLDAIILYFILKPEVGHRLGVIAMASFIYHPVVIGSLVGFHEVFLLFFLLLATLTFQQDHFKTSGFFVGLGILTKQIALVHAWVLFFSILILSDKKMESPIPLPSLWFTFTGLVTVVLGLLPFTLLAPRQMLEDILLIHLTRNDPNMSIYYYFGSFLDQSRVLFFFQAGSMLILPFYIKRHLTKPMKKFKGSVSGMFQLLFLTAFYLFNRIIYPHYLTQFIPWLVMTVVFSWYQFSKTINKNETRSILLLGSMILAHVIMTIGSGLWGLIWLLDSTPWTMNDNPLYPLAAITVFLALAAFLILQLLILNEHDQLTRKDPSNVPSTSL